MFRNFVKEILPPFLKRHITGLFYGWYGNYSEWEVAKNKCSGYNSQIILDKVKKSSLKVKAGSAAFERDSVPFEEIEYNFPVVSGLLWIVANNGKKLHVLDFGGSLGSTYYQNRLFLNSFNDIRWCIVEQPGFVEIGQTHFSDERLKFYYTIDDCLKENKIDIVLLSSVLPYLEKPYELLQIIKSKNIKYLMFDKMPLVKGDDRITIQKVNPGIYKASYPSWFFNYQKFLDFMIPEYELIYRFDDTDKANILSEFKGFLFKIKNVN